jgi:hypothetical protein
MFMRPLLLGQQFSNLFGFLLVTAACAFLLPIDVDIPVLADYVTSRIGSFK